MTTATKKAVRSVTIQPLGRGLSLPYPFHIDSRGMVGAQEFWKGSPHKLIGFCKRPIAGEIDLTFVDFWAEPKLCVRMFPVFAKKNGDWYTDMTCIESISLNR